MRVLLAATVCLFAMIAADAAPDMFSINNHALNTVAKADQQAQRMPRASEYSGAEIHYRFVSGDIYQVYCHPLAVTDIVFDKGEHIVSIAAGDTIRWKVSRTYSGSGENYQEHLLIKPTQAMLATNMVITTDERSYYLQLYSTNKTYMAVVAWRYPTAKVKRQVTPIKDQQQILKNLNHKHLNFHYHMKMVYGPKPDWTPVAIFNDGSKTYIQFPRTMQAAPLLFLGDDIDNDQITNYRVAGNYYIIDGIVKSAQLYLKERRLSVIQITKGGK